MLLFCRIKTYNLAFKRHWRTPTGVFILLIMSILIKLNLLNNLKFIGLILLLYIALMKDIIKSCYLGFKTRWRIQYVTRVFMFLQTVCSLIVRFSSFLLIFMFWNLLNFTKTLFLRNRLLIRMSKITMCLIIYLIPIYQSFSVSPA